MKKILLAFTVASIFAACNNSKTDSTTTTDSTGLKVDSSANVGTDTSRMNNYTDTGRLNNTADTSRMKGTGTKGTGNGVPGNSTGAKPNGGK